MKKISLRIWFCLLLPFFLLTSCEQDNLIQDMEEMEGKIDKTMPNDFSPNSQASFPELRIHRIPSNGIYVNNFRDEILLSDNHEDEKLFDWCKKHGYTHIALYTVSSILNNVSHTKKLESFVKKARSHHDLGVTFVAASLNALSKIESYVASNSQNEQSRKRLPTGIVTEYEFWNKGPYSAPNSFAYYESMLSQIKQINDNYGPFEVYLYVHKFKDYVGQTCEASVMQKTLEWIQAIDPVNSYVNLVNYRKNAQNFPASSSTVYQRMQRMTNMISLESPDEVDPQLSDCQYGPKLNMQLNIIPLFNVKHGTTSNMFHYFDEDGEDHAFQDAFISFYHGFLASGIENRDRLNLAGYQIYRYEEALEARD